MSRGLLFIHRCCDVDDADGDSCWLWRLTTNSKGYPQFRFGGPLVSVRRHAYELWHGAPLQRGLFLSPKCGEVSCVNPEHAQPLTRKQYSAHRKGVRRRVDAAIAARDALRAKAKLTLDAARAIRTRYAAGELQPQLAVAFGVSRSAISQVTLHKIWREPSPWAI